MGLGLAVASVALGVRVIEKHFTLNRDDGGVDSTFSMESDEMAALVLEARRAWDSLGKINYGATKLEGKSKIFRRSIYVEKDLKKGEILTRKNIRSIRPGFGLAPKHFDELLERSASMDLKRGQALTWHMINKN
jgi:sialic acid synthase SpsE